MQLVCTGSLHAPRVVLGNALGTDKRIWEPLHSILKDEFRFARFEYPGHGGSTGNAYESIAELGHRLLSSLDEAGIERFFYAGVSMGGAVGMELALAAPKRVLGLVLSNTAAHFGASSLWSQRIAQAQQNGLASLAQDSVSRWIVADGSRHEPETSTKLRAMFSSTTMEGYELACRALQAFDARARVMCIATPTLIIGGQHDVATPLARAVDLHHAIHGSEYLELPAAHLAPVDCPQDFTRALTRFIQSHNEC